MGAPRDPGPEDPPPLNVIGLSHMIQTICSLSNIYKIIFIIVMNKERVFNESSFHILVFGIDRGFLFIDIVRYLICFQSSVCCRLAGPCPAISQLYALFSYNFETFSSSFFDLQNEPLKNSQVASNIKQDIRLVD